MSTSSHRYDLLSSAYSVIGDAAEHEARMSGLALLGVRAGERVLEVGCGTGRALPPLAAAADCNGFVCAMDQSAGMLAHARRQAGEGHVCLQRADARRLPYRSAQFDAAFMSFTLELFTRGEMRVVLRQIRRVLKPQARLGIVALNLEHTVAVDAYRWLHRHFPRWIDCRPIDVLNVLARNGYQTIRSRRLQMWRLPVVAVVATPVLGVQSPRVGRRVRA